jgi:hypothetical protein
MMEKILNDEGKTSIFKNITFQFKKNIFLIILIHLRQ